MMRDAGGESALDQAARRLERALVLLEQRVNDRLARQSAEAGGLFDQDRSKLADELDEARARQRELEAAGLAASQALGEAIAEIDEALAGHLEDEGDAADDLALAEDGAAEDDLPGGAAADDRDEQGPPWEANASDPAAREN